MLQRLLLVAAGGAVGSVLRYVATSWIAARPGTTLPWGTLSVNVAGSFAMGLVVQAALRPGLLSDDAKAALAAGLLGGFTTFSAFSAEFWSMARDGAIGRAAGWALVSVAACVAAAGLGIAAGRAMFGAAE